MQKNNSYFCMNTERKTKKKKEIYYYILNIHKSCVDIILDI